MSNNYIFLLYHFAFYFVCDWFRHFYREKLPTNEINRSIANPFDRSNAMWAPNPRHFLSGSTMKLCFLITLADVCHFQNGPIRLFHTWSLTLSLVLPWRPQVKDSDIRRQKELGSLGRASLPRKMNQEHLQWIFLSEVVSYIVQEICDCLLRGGFSVLAHPPWDDVSTFAFIVTFFCSPPSISESHNAPWLIQ